MKDALATAESREAERLRYRPRHVRMLFVGEAPPASGRFFYCADSGLYLAVRGAFIEVLPSLERTDFLPAFSALGCYLMDLCGKPVDRLPRAERRRACVDGEKKLAATLVALRPLVVVTLVRSIAPNVRRALENSNHSCSVVEVPYPGRWKRHRDEFVRLVAPVLR
jgi:hypothetical protein